MTEYPAFFNASLYGGAALSNSVSVDDNDESLASTDLGICFITDGGWELLAFTYFGLSRGSLYGSLLPVSGYCLYAQIFYVLSLVSEPF